MPAITDDNRKWWILIAMALGGGLIMLDETVVGVALPTLRKDLSMSAVAAHWVVSIYMLVFAGLAAAGGRIGDLIGFKTLVLAGTAIFGASSLAAGFSQSGAFLIAARAVEGLGAAIIFPATIAMVMLAFPKEQRGMAIGILAAIGTVFLGIGPLAGGFLTELVSWRWIFWVNVPVAAAIAAIVFLASADPPRDPDPQPFDGWGLITLVAGLTALVFAIMQGADWGWTNIAIAGCLFGGLALLALFAVIETRQKAPLINVDLFANASFSGCIFVIFAGQFSKIAIVVFGALYLQDKTGMSPLTTGFALLVSVAAFPFLSAPVGRLADKTGARALVLSGMTLATLGMIWLGVAVRWDSYVLLLPGLIGWGLGMPLCYAPALRAMANSVAMAQQGQASGIGVTSRLIGGVIGMAIGSALLAATGSFGIVFSVTAAVMATAVAFGWFAIDRTDARA